MAKQEEDEEGGQVDTMTMSAKLKSYTRRSVLLLLLVCLLEAAVVAGGAAFVPHGGCVSLAARKVGERSGARRMKRRLYGMSEWRDLTFDFPGSDRRLGREEGSPPREICLLPFPYRGVLLQGETKQLRLHEHRYIQLFEEAMTGHCGVVAMGLLADSGMIQAVSLCEVEAYNRHMEDTFGIFVTLRVVGRATLLDLTQRHPYLKGVCTEIMDVVPPNLDLPNLVAGTIENSMILLSSMEFQLQQQQQQQHDHDDDGDHRRHDSTTGKPSDHHQRGDKAMRRRILEAELENGFHHDDDSDDGEEEDMSLDRTGRFRKAFHTAIATDTQGYRVVGPPSNSGGQRNVQDLTAIGWAAFCTEIPPEGAATFRVRALDGDDLLERLKLASVMLREKQAELQTRLTTAGIKHPSSDDNDEYFERDNNPT